MPTNIKNYYCKHICHSQKKINLEIRKNTRDFLKFPPNTLLLTMDFYNDEEIEGIRKLLLDLEIKLNIFDQRKQHSCIFWYMLLISCTNKREIKFNGRENYYRKNTE